MHDDTTRVRIDVSQQTLTLLNHGQIVMTYPVSTAKNGVGELKDSGKTPRGMHVIRAKIGAQAPLGAVFVGRRQTGDVATLDFVAQHPERDWILSRILWLSGLEVGLNRLGSVDTMQRYIYIHGSADEARIGLPVSKGCIRMKNQDIIDIFDQVNAGCIVDIVE